MSLCNLILLISIVGFSTSSSMIRPQSLLIVRLSPQSTSLEDTADRWKKVHPEPKAPQIQIYLMKNYVSSDEKWAFSNEYKYSGDDYDDAAKATSMTDEKKVSRVETDDIDTREKKKQNNASVQDVVMPDEFIPQIGSRNIITAPTYCPAGQRMDNRGRCRTIIM